MRDLLNIFDSVVNEVTISKPKYGPGTQFAVASGSQNGQALLQQMTQQGFDATPPLTMQDTSELGDQEILNLPAVAVSKGGDGYLFANEAGQYILVTGTAASIGPCFNVYTGAAKAADDAEDVGKIANRGETSEGILGAAMFAKFTKREAGEDIGTVTADDISGVLDSLQKTGQDQYEIEVEDYDNKHADRITFVLRLKTGPYQDLMDPAKRPLLASEYASAAAYVNSSDAERYSRYFYINGRADQITIMADGVTGEKTQKTDVWVYVTDENGQPRKLRLNTSLKVGGVGQFGQVGGDSEETQETLWGYFGVDVSPALAAFKKAAKGGDTRAAFEKVYQYAAKQIDNELKNADPEDEANMINKIAQGITHFATLGDPKVELVDFSKGGFKILRFNNLVEKLSNVDLAASYEGGKSWPEVVIHERGNPNNKLLKVRMKIENKPKGIYVRNYIEKEALLEKLTEYKKASWDNETSTQALDRVSDRRLTGPGAKAAKIKFEPKTDAATLGRERRSR
jgi:hypothetical protein